METTEPSPPPPRLELTKAPRKAPALDLRDIPQAPGPEKGVLALMAMDPATYVGQCVTIGMTEDYFYLPAHKLLWRLFQTRYNKNEPIDIVSITQALEDMHQLEAVGGSAGLAEIYTFTTTGAYFEHYLNVLKDKFILRSIIDIATRSTTQPLTIRTTWRNCWTPWKPTSPDTGTLQQRQGRTKPGKHPQAGCHQL